MGGARHRLRPKADRDVRTFGQWLRPVYVVESNTWSAPADCCLTEEETYEELVRMVDPKARMLMNAAKGHLQDRHDDDSHRTEQRMRERAEWRKEAEMPEDEAAQADADNDPDPGCGHGCNGDCLLSGSDVCTWQCHTFDAVQGYYQWVIRKLEVERASRTTDSARQEELSRQIYARKMALASLAADEMTRMAGLGD